MVEKSSVSKKLKDLFDKKEKEEKEQLKEKKTLPTKPNFNNESINVNNKNFSGLKNLGNTCYINVAIQCLLSNKNLINILKEKLEYVKNEDQIIIETEYNCLYNLSKTLEFYMDKTLHLATKFIKTLGLIYDPFSNQNDSGEFISFILNQIDLEISKIDNKFKSYNIDNTKKNIESKESEWEVVKKDGKRMKLLNEKVSSLRSNIGGIISYEIIKSGTSLTEIRSDPFFILNVNNKNQVIEHNISSYFNKNDIDGSKEIKTKFYIDNLSDFIIIQVKSFYYDKNRKQILKDKNPLKFDFTLEIKKEWVNPFKEIEFKNLKYELCSIIVHLGKEVSEGHYICYSKTIENNIESWLMINDDKIIKVNKSDILKLRPYLLFYKKL